MQVDNFGQRPGHVDRQVLPHSGIAGHIQSARPFFISEAGWRSHQHAQQGALVTPTTELSQVVTSVCGQMGEMCDLSLAGPRSAASG